MAAPAAMIVVSGSKLTLCQSPSVKPRPRKRRRNWTRGNRRRASA